MVFDMLFGTIFQMTKKIKSTYKAKRYIFQRDLHRAKIQQGIGKKSLHSNTSYGLENKKN